MAERGPDQGGSGSEIILYQTEEGSTKVEVRLEGETVWLSQKQMCDLFEKDKRTVSEHIRNVFKEGELQEDSVVRNFRTTATDGKSYHVVHYNLDVVISVGYLAVSSDEPAPFEALERKTESLTPAHKRKERHP